MVPRYIPHYKVNDYQLWEGQWELWSGVPIAMSPSADRLHQRISGRLFQRLDEALRAGGCRRCEVLYEIDCVAAEEWTDLDCDLLVLDPPRSGCHPKLIKRLAAEGPQTLLYVSCNPARLAEEMRVLGQRYRLERLQCFDFFPQTPHIEALCLLRLKLAG